MTEMGADYLQISPGRDGRNYGQFGHDKLFGAIVRSKDIHHP
jgi:hypothetical protein